jgi:3-phenylpropionate/cinnamic acid dioxygenase small subunit
MTSTAGLERLLAIEDIKHLKSRYFRYVDQKDWTEWRALFADDGHFEIGTGTFDDADTFVANVREFLRDATTFHHGHMPEINVLGPDEATGVWTLYDVVEPSVESGVSPFYGYARYWERYERRGEEWKIASMRIERLRKVDYRH